LELTESETSPPSASALVERVVVLAGAASVAEALVELRREQNLFPFVAVCEEGRLVGLVDASSLLGAEAEIPLERLLKPPDVVVDASLTAEHAAWLAAHAGAEAVAVTDRDERFLGLVPASRLLALMVHEHEVDLARLGGFLRGSTQARTAAEESVTRRVWHRAPWLLVGLAGAVAAAQIVRAFESDLEARVALAFFLPGIVYMADAVGTQTETLVIRGISVGVQPGRIFRLEALAGAAIGALLSLAIFPLALFVTGEEEIAAVVSLSLLASASCATVVAVSLPYFIQRLNYDPAFGSGPLATVVQDLLSILIYFGIAAAIAGS
jgi:magnesium transporter